MLKEESVGNPFLAIWVRPRRTIRAIIDVNPLQHVWGLAAISGVYQTLDRLIGQSIGVSLTLPITLLLTLLIGAFGGIISLIISSVLFSWSGRKLGGVGKSTDVRAALAWASVPDGVLLLISLLLIMLYGQNVFSASTAWVQGSAIIVLGVATLVSIILLIWRVVLSVHCLAEVHQFSAIKSILAFILGTLIIAIPIAIIAVLIVASS